MVVPAAGNSAIGTGQDWLEYSCFLRKVFKMLPDALILVMDCAPAHLAESKIQAASNQDLLMFALPA